MISSRILLLAIAAASLPALAPAAPRLLGPAEALGQDATEYSRLYGVTTGEAFRRLAAQEETVAATDRIRAAYRDRIAGISVEHRPHYRILVLLTGSDPVPDEILVAGGIEVPVVFRTGATASRDQLLAAIDRHRAAIQRATPRLQGIGIDQRTGELVVSVRTGRNGRREEGLAARIAARTGVPVRVRLLGGTEASAGDSGATASSPQPTGIRGGARVAGIEPVSGIRQACTTGFVVTDGKRSGVVTAAHCPDTLDYLGEGGRSVPLGFAGQWGARYQDVQVHPVEEAALPHFYADTAKRAIRAVRTWRNRESTRAGDVVCRRGETTGYSCAEVELTDYAPAGTLCGGPCDPLWTTVAGPACRGGDSGGPVFLGSTAFGIVKGSSYGPGPDRPCLFSFYMSTDYLPEGWRLAWE